MNRDDAALVLIVDYCTHPDRPRSRGVQDALVDLAGTLGDNGIVDWPEWVSSSWQFEPCPVCDEPIRAGDRIHAECVPVARDDAYGQAWGWAQ